MPPRYPVDIGAGVETALIRLGREARRWAERAVAEEGDAILSEALELTPFEYGALRSTGSVGRVKRVGNRTEVEITFGGHSPLTRGVGGEVDYAAAVHEARDKTFVVGGPQFLRLPVEASERSGRLLRRIADTLRRRGVTG